MAVICLLDDDPLQARVIVDNLQAMGHSVVWARHGWDALLLTRRVHPNLVLVDCATAQWLELLTILRTIRGFDTTPLVLLCAHYPPRYYLKKLGVVCTISKPFSAALLLEQVCGALHSVPYPG